jgi:hypothetical protein
MLPPTVRAIAYSPRITSNLLKYTFAAGYTLYRWQKKTFQKINANLLTFSKVHAARAL